MIVLRAQAETLYVVSRDTDKATCVGVDHGGPISGKDCNCRRAGRLGTFVIAGLKRLLAKIGAHFFSPGD
jgi:hypothetical protein